ncbi:MAG: hypothetical protein H6835_04840 [Planctomycetes bacterium]|nr:hypothetical protein [Planctomycetota bacterium]
MKLLLADLRALVNLPATAIGRRATFGLLVGLLLLGALSWWFASTVADNPRLLLLLEQRGQGASLRGLLGYGLMACPMVSTWLGLAMAQRQLFETPELWLWRTAPLPGWRGPLQVLLRAAFLSAVWAGALAGPFVVALLRRSPAGPTAYALLPVAIVACTLPLLATLLSAQIAMARFLSGRALRMVFAALAGAASVGFTLWLLLQLFTTRQHRVQELVDAAAPTRALPPTIEAAAQLLERAASGTAGLADLLPVLGWIGGATALFFAAALLHPRAHERHLEADRPLWRGRGRRWPASLPAAIRKKEFAQVLQQPGALIGFVVFAVLVFGLAQQQVLVTGILANFRVPRELRVVVAMLTQWFLAVLFVLYTHMGRLSLWDGAQWSLYMAAPPRPRAILRGKLQAIAVFLLWPLLLVILAGVKLLDADLLAVSRFVGVAIGGTLAALGVIAVVGTWPRLMRPDRDGQILQGGKTFLAAMVMVTLFEVTLAPAAIAWWWLGDHPHSFTSAELAQLWPHIVGLAIGYGALVGLAGLWLGGRNYRRLLQPN